MEINVFITLLLSYALRRSETWTIHGENVTITENLTTTQITL